MQATREQLRGRRALLPSCDSVHGHQCMYLGSLPCSSPPRPLPSLGAIAQVIASAPCCLVMNRHQSFLWLGSTGSPRFPALPASACIEKNGRLRQRVSRVAKNRCPVACPPRQAARCTIRAPLYDSCSMLPFQGFRRHTCVGAKWIIARLRDFHQRSETSKPTRLPPCSGRSRLKGANRSTPLQDLESVLHASCKQTSVAAVLHSYPSHVVRHARYTGSRA